jgi:spermidine synthase
VIDLLFFLSGGAGLALEVVWVRQLGWITGTTATAVALVLAVFLGGLGLGGFLLGRLADPRAAAGAGSGAAALRLYGLLELGIAAAAALVTWLLDALAQPGTGALGSGLPPRWAPLAALFLLLPTLLMGATLPVASRVAVRSFARAGARISRLYALNTLGAALGALATGFWLLPHLGVIETGFGAAALDGAVGLVALALGRAGAARAVSEPPPIASGPPPIASGPTIASRPPLPHRLPIRLLFALAGASGFITLGCEILWTRLLVYSTGSTIYAFAGMLATFLLGLVGASAWASFRLARGCDPARELVISQAAAAFLLMAGLVLLPKLLPANPDRFAFATWPALLGGTLGPAFRLVLLPTLALGQSFPLLNALRLAEERRLGREVGGIYAANTLGAIAGSLGVALLLLPALGSARAMAVLAGLSLAGAALVLAMHSGRRTRALAGIALAVAIALPILAPGRAAVRTVTLRDATTTRDPTDLLAYEEGAMTTVAVVRDRLGFHDPEAKRLLTDGMNMSGTNWNAKRYMRFLAHLPILLHPAPRSVLVIGLGTGMTAGAAALHPEVSEVVTAEIAPEVARAAQYFATENYGVLDSPKHRLMHADGRHFLRSAAACYDVILAEPPPPRASSTTHLYSREYYLACRDALHPGGYCLQWMPLHSQGDLELRAKLATFLDVFPQASLWLPNGEEAIVLGVAPGGPVRVKSGDAGTGLAAGTLMAQRMADPAVAPALDEVGLATPEDLLACYAFGAEALARYTRDQPLVTDRHPFTQATIDHPRLLDPFDLLRLITLTEPVPPSLAAGARSEAELGAAREAVGEMVRGQILDHAAQLFEAYHRAPANRYYRQLCLADSAQVEALAAEIARRPNDPDLALLQTQVLATQGRKEAAFAAIADLIARAPERPSLRLAAARLAIHLGDPGAGFQMLAAAPRDAASEQASQAAQSFLSLALAAESALGGARMVAAHDYLEVLTATREFGLARRVAADLVSQAPGVPRNLAALAIALDVAGYPERASTLYDELTLVAPDDPGLARARGRALFYAGRPADAEPLLRAAAARDPGDVELQRLHAEACRELGRYAEAQQAIWVLESSPDPNDRLLALDRARTYRLLAAEAGRHTDRKR